VARQGDDHRRGRRPLRAVLRFIAAVMTTSGILLLADAGLTLAWQEPISSLIASTQQSALADELDERPAPDGRDGRDLSKAELVRLAERYEDRIESGDAWGRVELPTLDREYVVIEGTEEAPLRRGPGHYPETPNPGHGGTVAIAGHRTTYLAPFRTIDQLEEGDEVVVEMPWARFTYAVEKQEIVEPTQTEVTRKVGHERLVLSACHPLYSAAQRIIIFAELEDVEPV
jgi:sortase A